MKVRIKGKDYEFRFDSVWGPLYTYEDIVGERMPYNPQKLMCVHVMLYCILLRCNEDIDVTLDEFLNALNDIKMEKAMREYYFRRTEELSRGVDEATENGQEEGDKKKD